MQDKFNIIMLDMDGVVNSSELCKKWINNRFLIQESNNHLTDQEVRNAVREAYKKQFVNSKQLVFPQLAKIICDICQICDAYIVWSSTWRMLPQYKDIEDAKNMFNRRGLPGDRLIDYTPVIRFNDGGYRSSCINQWLNKNKDKYNVKKVAVIDDRWDAGCNLNEKCMFFQTDDCLGITEQLKTEVINYFNN